MRRRVKIYPAEKEVAPQRKVWYDTPRDKQRYRSGHNGADSKFLEAPAVSSAENVHRTGLCAGSDFTISYRSCVFFLHSSRASITLEIYGELSERSKVRHSKCRVPKRNLGFESLTLRQKPSHIKAFAHMTGLFFSLKVTSAYMIFGKSSGVPAGLPCIRQSQDIVHYICRGDLGLVIQVGVDVRRGGEVAMAQPLLNVLERHAVGQQQAGTAVPLRYNKDKREKPVFSMGLSVCRSHFNSFSNIETDAKI